MTRRQDYEGSDWAASTSPRKLIPGYATRFAISFSRCHMHIEIFLGIMDVRYAHDLRKNNVRQSMKYADGRMPERASTGDS